MIIVNGSQPLTIITKHSILDVAASLDPPLGTEKSWISPNPQHHHRKVLRVILVYLMHIDITVHWSLHNCNSYSFLTKVISRSIVEYILFCTRIELSTLDISMNRSHKSSLVYLPSQDY